jgi:hypothetical protein
MNTARTIRAMTFALETIFYNTFDNIECLDRLRINDLLNDMRRLAAKMESEEWKQL